MTKQSEDKISHRQLLCLTVLQQEVLDKSKDDFTNEKVKRFVECVQTYAHVQTKAFITLVFANNYMAAHHFLRLMSDCALRVYAVTLFKGKDLEKYIDKFFAGKEPSKSKYKGKYLMPEYIMELIKQEDIYGDIIPAFQKEGNRSTHLSNFYQPEIAESVTDEDKKDMIGYYGSLLCFLGGLLSRLK